MNYSELSAIAETIGALGIIITLVYLAIQIRQGNAQARSQSLQTAIEGFLDCFENATSTIERASIFRRGLNDFDCLSEEEQGCFHSVMHSLLTGLSNVLNMHRVGLLPEYELVAMTGVYISMLISPGGGRWWGLFKGVPPSGLVDYIDEAIRKSEGTITPANEKFPWLGVKAENIT